MEEIGILYIPPLAPGALSQRSGKDGGGLFPTTLDRSLLISAGVGPPDEMLLGSAELNTGNPRASVMNDRRIARMIENGKPGIQARV